MSLPLPAITAFANDLAWAFGLKDGSGERMAFAEPRDAKGAKLLLRRLGIGLDGVRPVAGAYSVGDIVAALYWSGARAGEPPSWPPKREALRPGRRGTKRAYAELEELVALGTHGRAKRQERRRVLAEIVVLYDLEPSLEIARVDAPDAALDVAARAVSALLRGR